jgi:hypothetical protein
MSGSFFSIQVMLSVQRINTSMCKMHQICGKKIKVINEIYIIEKKKEIKEFSCKLTATS